MKELAKIIRVARGRMPADLVLRNARIVNVFSAEVYEGDIAILGERIVGIGEGYEGKKEIDLERGFLLPGLIDGHMHIESTMVKVQEFARSVVPRGTTSVICDPHEIANVHGIEGIHYILNSSKYSPVNIFVMLSSCVPATAFETSGANLRGFDLYPLLREKWVLGLGEVMNYPGVLREDEGLLDKISMTENKRIDGHAPGLTGKDLNAYVAAGVDSDHESTSIDEVLEKLRLGMYIMIREGSVTKNLRDLLPVVTCGNLSRCFFVTDDRHPKDLLEKGHIDHMVKMAVKEGLDPISAIRMATINTAQYFGLKDLGAIAPGYIADLVVVDSLKRLNVKTVFKSGRVVARDGEMVVRPPATPQLTLRSSINIKWLAPSDFDIPAEGKRVRVINLVPDQIVTEATVEPANTKDGFVVSDVERDVLKIAVVERHLASDNIGQGLVRGFGLKKGAIASSVAHDSHNIVVVGTSSEDMMAAVVEISKMRGGLSVVRDGKLLAGLPLPVAGLMSEGTLSEVVAGLKQVVRAAKRLGSHLDDPFMTMSFLALPVIPALKLTDKGLVDVEAFELTSLFV